MCSKLPKSCDISASQLTKPAVRPGNIARPSTNITTTGVVPSAIIRLQSSLSSSSRLELGVAHIKCFAAADERGGGGTRRLASSALTPDLSLCRCGDQELRLSASDGFERRIVKRAVDRVRMSAISPIFFFRFGQASPVVEVVQAGDPVLHEPAVELRPEEIGTARVEKIINDMVATMRNAPGVGLAAPQIGVNLQIIVLEDTKELMSYSSPEECEAQQRFPFDLLVIINPKLKFKSDSGTAIFFEGCLSVEGYRALVERDLEVEVTGLGRDGRPIRVEASGWKARILQHECDHIAGNLYVDKMVPRTFRTKDNLRLPLPAGCPKQGVCKHSTKSLQL